MDMSLSVRLEDNSDLEELFTLAAINAIDARDIELAETLATSSPELQAELAALRDTAAAIAYVMPLPSLPANLEDRLWARIDAEDAANAEQLPSPVPHPLFHPAFYALRVGDRKWQPHPVPGVSISMLHMDDVTRKFSCLVRCEPGVAYPLHRHAVGEEIFILEGDLIADGVTYLAGDYLYSAADSIHAPSTKDGCMFLARTSLDDTYDEFQ
jgi:anti-sigma factor ChrR (cupin superfamily)